MVEIAVKHQDENGIGKIVDTGQIVGNTALKFSGNPTSWRKIFTDRAGNIITTFPIPKP